MTTRPRPTTGGVFQRGPVTGALRPEDDAPETPALLVPAETPAADPLAPEAEPSSRPRKGVAK